MSILSVVYVLGGFGLRGGWKEWGETGRTVYCLVFPFHVVVFEIFKWLRSRRHLLWDRIIGRPLELIDCEYSTVISPFGLTVFLVWYWLCGQYLSW